MRCCSQANNPKVGPTLPETRAVPHAMQPHTRVQVALWGSGLAALALLLGLGIFLAPLEPNIVALQLSFSPSAFGAIVHAWGEGGLARYRTHLPWDYLLLLNYGLFGWLLATRTAVLAPYPTWARRMAAWLMPLASAFDAIENALHGWLTQAPRFGLEPIYAASGTVSLLKWLLLMAFAVAVAHALWLQQDR